MARNGKAEVGGWPWDAAKQECLLRDSTRRTASTRVDDIPQGVHVALRITLILHLSGSYCGGGI